MIKPARRLMGLSLLTLLIGAPAPVLAQFGHHRRPLPPGPMQPEGKAPVYKFKVVAYTGKALNGFELGQWLPLSDMSDNGKVAYSSFVFSNPSLRIDKGEWQALFVDQSAIVSKGEKSPVTVTDKKSGISYALSISAAKFVQFGPDEGYLSSAVLASEEGRAYRMGLFKEQRLVLTTGQELQGLIDHGKTARWGDDIHEPGITEKGEWFATGFTPNLIGIAACNGVFQYSKVAFKAYQRTADTHYIPRFDSRAFQNILSLLAPVIPNEYKDRAMLVGSFAQFEGEKNRTFILQCPAGPLYYSIQASLRNVRGQIVFSLRIHKKMPNGRFLEAPMFTALVLGTPTDLKEKTFRDVLLPQFLDEAQKSIGIEFKGDDK